MNKQAWFIAFLILGLACSGWGMLQVKTTGEFVKNARSVHAQVTYLNVKIKSPDQKIESRHKASRHSRSVYRTIVFTTHTGQRVGWQPVFTPTWRSGSGGGIGMTVRNTYVPSDKTIDVLYDPDDPNRFEIDSFFNLWTPAVLSIVGGLALLGMATAIEMGFPVLEPFALLFSLIARPWRRRHGAMQRAAHG